MNKIKDYNEINSQWNSLASLAMNIVYEYFWEHPSVDLKIEIGEDKEQIIIELKMNKTFYQAVVELFIELKGY